MVAHWELVTVRCDIQGSSALARNREWAELRWDTERHCSCNTNLAEMARLVVAGIGIVFPGTQSHKWIHFYRNVHDFWHKALVAMVLFLCPYLHSSAWEVTVLPVWRSQASKHLILNAIFQLGAGMFSLSLPRVDLPCFHLLPQVWLLTAAAGDEPRPMKG